MCSTSREEEEEEEDGRVEPSSVRRSIAGFSEELRSKAPADAGTDGVKPKQPAGRQGMGEDVEPEKEPCGPKDGQTGGQHTPQEA